VLVVASWLLLCGFAFSFSKEVFNSSFTSSTTPPLVVVVSGASPLSDSDSGESGSGT